MYYQWGDKDPYFTPSGETSNYEGIDAGNWGGENKSTTDPCPPGYRVPSVSVWAESKNSLTLWLPSHFQYEGDPYVNYPYSYYIESSTNKPVTAEKVILRARDTATKVIGLDNKYTPATKYKLDHEVYYMKQIGSLWANHDQKSLYFHCNTKVVLVYQGWKMDKVNNGKWYSPNYQWPEDKDEKWTKLTDAEIEALNSDTGSTIMGYFVSEDAPENIYNRAYDGYSNSGSGLQVRCVSESSPVK